MTPSEAIGTPSERWAAAELDVLLGRVTARELWELGREIIADHWKHANALIKEAQEERDEANDVAAESLNKVDQLEAKILELKAGAKK